MKHEEWIMPLGATRIVWSRAIFLFTVSLVVLGYPVVGAIRTILDLASSDLSYALRIFNIILCGLVLILCIARRKFQSIPMIILIFFGIYFVRLYYDAFIFPVGDADQALTFFLATIFIPVLALTCGTDWYDDYRLALVISIVGGITCVLLIYSDALGVGGESDLAAGGRLFSQYLDPITIGYTALYTALGCFVLFGRVSHGTKIVLAVAILCAIYVLIRAAARGPLVAGVFALAFIMLARRQIFRFGLLSIAGLLLATVASDKQLELFARLKTVGVDESSSERLFAMHDAWAQFLTHPAYGNAYIDLVSMNYPHNLLLESGMALGLGGMALMALILVRMTYAAWAIGSRGYQFLSLLIVCEVANAFMSASLWSSASFWLGASFGLTILGRLASQSYRERPKEASRRLAHTSHR